MTADLVARLRAALDRAESIALAASQPYEYASEDATAPAGGVHWTWVVGENWTPVTVDPVVDSIVGGDERAGCPVNLASVEEWRTEGSDHGWPVRTMPRVVAHEMVEVDACAALHIVSWGPATVVRLVERDRALLAAFERADGYVAEHVEQCGEGLCSCREYLTWTATAGALRMVVERAAQFWLGNP